MTVRFHDVSDLQSDPTASFLGVLPVPTISKNTDEAALQITRTNSSWNATFGDPVTVTYAFRATAPAAMPDDTAGFSVFNQSQIDAALKVLQAWMDVANIVFTRVTDTGSAYSNNASILFGNYATGAAGAAAFANFPDPAGTASTDVAGDVWINSTETYNATPVRGDYGPQVFLHELGHAIGLSHPGDYNASANQALTYAANAEYIQDSRQYSIMSYFEETNTGANYQGAYGEAPMLHDIAALQRVYGANTATLTGNTVYGFNSNTAREWYTATTPNTVLIFTAWDAGGTDTFDFSGYTAAQKIDLNAEAYSDVGGLTKNVSIAKGVVIENAIGGSGNDVIVGNAADNVITGNGGADTLTGGAGADTFRYAAATDSVAAAPDGIADFTRAQGDKIDLSPVTPSAVGIVQSGAISLLFVTAPGGAMQINVVGDVEAFDVTTGGVGITLQGDGAGTTLLGGAANDAIFGNGGNDTLIGSLGADVLFGGAGSDTFKYLAASESNSAGADLIADFVTGSDKIDLSAANPTAIAIIDNGTNSLVFANTAGGQIQVGSLGNVNGNDIIANIGVTIQGGAASSQLTGGNLSDYLFGEDGNDTLVGGGGVDILFGGNGADTFRYLSASDSTSAAPDLIADFQTGVDKIDLTGTGMTAVGIANNIVFASGPGGTMQIGSLQPIALSDIILGGAAPPLAALAVADHVEHHIGLLI